MPALYEMWAREFKGSDPLKHPEVAHGIRANSADGYRVRADVVRRRREGATRRYDAHEPAAHREGEARRHHERLFLLPRMERRPPGRARPVQPLDWRVRESARASARR